MSMVDRVVNRHIAASSENTILRKPDRKELEKNVKRGESDNVTTYAGKKSLKVPESRKPVKIEDASDEQLLNNLPEKDRKRAVGKYKIDKNKFGPDKDKGR